MAKGIFAGITNKDQKPRGDAQFVGLGTYLVRISEFTINDRRPPKTSKVVRVLMDVLHVVDDAGGHADHRVGDSLVWMTINDSDYFYKEINSFIKQITGVDVTEMDADEGEAFVEGLLLNDGSKNSQPLRGTLAEIQGRWVKTKKVDEQGNPISIKRPFWKRAVSFAEAGDLLTEDEIKRFFPGDSLPEAILKEEELKEKMKG